MSSGDNHIPMSSFSSELRVKIDDEEEEEPRGHRLTFSSPLTSSVFQVDTDDRIEKDDENIKKGRKSIDDNASVKKRKDTATSISNFFHRLTMVGRNTDDHKKDDRKSESDREKQSSVNEKSIDRPDKLHLPDKAEQWFEPSMIAEYQTALDAGTFWATEDETEEIFPPDISKAMIRSERDSELDAQERSIVRLLDEFRSGRMKALGDEQVNMMKEAKQAHEDVTRVHLQLYSKDFEALDDGREADQLYEGLSEKLYHMHSTAFI